MQGRLIYVVGASGAGKDSVMRYAREALDGKGRVVFAHRYITRAIAARDENHVALSRREFLLRRRHGLFALHWESHRLLYGIGVEIDAWLNQALTVVVNGSRAAIPRAIRRYPALEVVWITARPALLASRLRKRGRETGPQIGARLARNAQLGAATPGGAVRIDNEGPIERAGCRLVALLSGRTL